MNESRRSGTHIRVTTRDVSGSQFAVGHDIEQRNVREAPTEADVRDLLQLLAALRAQVESEAPVEQRAAAVAKVDELAEALAQPEPDLATMESVRNWFVRRLPALAGGVTGVLINPIVGKLVGAAGDALAAEFKRRFGA
jgi:hypothetical protein